MLIWINIDNNASDRGTDPANNAVIARCPESTAEDVQKAIQAAEQALPAWKTKSGRERSRILRQWYDLVLHNEDDLATLITLENGKAASEAHGEVLFTASFLEWFSEEAARIYGDVIPATSPGNRISVIREPIGVCGMITPFVYPYSMLVRTVKLTCFYRWNYPAGMITRKAGAALAAGCTAVIKTDGRTPLTGYALALLAERAGVPRGVINIITAWENTPIIGQTMCKSNTIRKISFTGSTRVGKILMEQSGKSLQKLSLELGGNAPVIVFDDANLELAVEGVLTSKFKSSGQTCVCANRIYIQDGIYDRFVSRLAQRVLGFKVGAGSDNSVTHGPLIEASAVAKSKEHVDDAVSKGARVLVGGKELPFLGESFRGILIEQALTLNRTQFLRSHDFDGLQFLHETGA